MNNITDKIAIIIPARNEDRIIDDTLRSLLQFFPASDIYLIDDCSNDTTFELAKIFIDNVFTLKIKCGKAEALNIAINRLKLTEKYDYIFPLDADTKINADFIKNALKIFQNDKNQQILAVVGKIVGTTKSWVTSYRLWEYEIGQTIHKKAQDKENAILVCSGCTTIYRSSLFNKLSIPSSTMTEDMDLTFEIHRRNLGKIVFCDVSVAVTQDPLTLKDFLKQTERWYTGYWQCVYKHKIPFGRQSLDFEVALNSIEGLFGSFIVLGFIFLIPWLIINNPYLLLTALSIDFMLFLIPTIILTILKHKTYKLLIYPLHFYFLRAFSSLVFLKSYFKAFMGLSFNKWNKVNRYNFK